MQTAKDMSEYIKLNVAMDKESNLEFLNPFAEVEVVDTLSPKIATSLE
jgi:hypothetical protein